MTKIDYKEHNRRFDERFSKLLKAGFKHYTIQDNAFSHGGLGRKGPFGKTVFISATELMWKPTEAFDYEIREMFNDINDIND